MKLLTGISFFLGLWAGAPEAWAEVSAYETLALKIAATGTQAGVSRYELEPFGATGAGVAATDAEQAKSELAQELLALPGVGAMDTVVLTSITTSRSWAQAVLSGTLYNESAARTLVVRLNDLRGRRLGTWQIDLQPARLPADLRDAPGPVSPCEKMRRELLAENREKVELKARYWAARIRAPGFSYYALERTPGSEIKEYASLQRFYRHVNAYYEQDGPVRLTPEEKDTVEKLFKKEAAFTAQCGEK